MRFDIFVPSIVAEDQVRFYVDELGLFRVRHDYGLGNFLLAHTCNHEFCLQLVPGQDVSKERPIFSLAVENLTEEVARLRSVEFRLGGFYPSGGEAKILEYPLGRSMTMLDASGNMIVLAEWHSGAA